MFIKIVHLTLLVALVTLFMSCVVAQENDTTTETTTASIEVTTDNSTDTGITTKPGNGCDFLHISGLVLTVTYIISLL